jgi:hypothetical protein
MQSDELSTTKPLSASFQLPDYSITQLPNYQFLFLGFAIRCSIKILYHKALRFRRAGFPQPVNRLFIASRGRARYAAKQVS